MTRRTAQLLRVTTGAGPPLALAAFSATILPPIELAAPGRAMIWTMTAVIALLAGAATQYLSSTYSNPRWTLRWTAAAVLALAALVVALVFYNGDRARYTAEIAGTHVVVGTEQELTELGALYREQNPAATPADLVRRTAGKPHLVWHAAAIHRHALRMRAYFFACEVLAAVGVTALVAAWRSKTSAPIAAPVVVPTPLAATHTNSARRFYVALSFPGEVRDRAGGIAEALERELGRERVFYDLWYRGELARPNMDLYLQDIYRSESDLLVVLLCSEYERKDWCGLEWRVVRDLVKGRESERIMFLRLDDAPISGLLSIDGYLEITTLTDDEVAAAILSRIRRTASSRRTLPAPAAESSA